MNSYDEKGHQIKPAMTRIINLSASEAIESRCFLVSASLRKHRMFSPSRYLMVMSIAMSMSMVVGDGDGNDSW